MEYSRILLKLSGEALMGDKGFGIDSILLEKYSSEIKNIHDKGIEVAVVIGGGNIYRGIEAEESGIKKVLFIIKWANNYNYSYLNKGAYPSE